MHNPIDTAKLQIKTLIKKAFEEAADCGELATSEIPDFTVEIPKETTHGDFAANVALVSAKSFKMAPRALAEAVVKYLDLSGSYFEKTEIAGPGFINFFVGEEWFAYAVTGVLEAGENFGRSDIGGGEKIMVEFVSANPTGPMHMGNARGGAIGDCLVSAMNFAGYDCHREFLINDAGNQIEKFALSLEARYLQEYLGEDALPFPEDGYHGQDIREHAKQYIALHGSKLLEVPSAQRKKELAEFALPQNIQKMRTDLEKYKITYDVWFSEQTLHDSGAVAAAIDKLKARGCTYEKDGALWYKASEYGCEKDDVLIRANGVSTYLAADIAYHYDKFAVRNFKKVINIWGADHHGHVARLKGAMDAIGLCGDDLDILLMQLVRLTKDGEVVKMSKRTGNAITLSDLLDDVPVDAARFFFNMREANSAMDFDLTLASEQSSQNPVYYVQYAHARICSIIANLKSEGVTPLAAGECNFKLLEAPEERELIKQLSLLPSEIIGVCKTYETSRLPHFATAVATQFHKFYNACRVKVDDKDLMQARLGLCLATKTAIANVLEILKISAPEVM